MSDDDNIHRLGIRSKAPNDDDTPLRVVSKYGGCQHDRLAIDEALAEVECKDCGEKLNPIWALIKLARYDNHLAYRRSALREEVAALENRTRYKCGACGQMNNLTKTLRFRAR